MRPVTYYDRYAPDACRNCEYFMAGYDSCKLEYEDAPIQVKLEDGRVHASGICDYYKRKGQDKP